jgi:programmed cell death protein 4
MDTKYLNDLDDDIQFVQNGRSNSCDAIAEEDEVDVELALANGVGPGGDLTTMSEERKAAALRIIRRAKRAGLARDRAYSTSEGGTNNHLPTLLNGIAVGGPHNRRHSNGDKNSRKSRSGFGRGLPKKGGAGGKGTWGKLGCELELPWIDPNDPNYESDSEKAESPKAINGKSNVDLKALVPEMSEEDVRKAVEPLILEYFENSDSMEVLFTLQEMLPNLGARRWMVVTITVELAMDHKPSHRELASVLISDLYQKVISQRDIGKAFDFLMKNLDDLVLDTPDAPTILGNFMARAIADDCIPPKFILSYKGHVDTELAGKSLCRADTLLSIKHGLVRLDNVWGVGGGLRPVKYLIKQIVLLLKEYLCSGDIGEASRCLRELEVPHFHHELVYEAVVMVIESMHEKTEEAMCKLLQALFRSFIISIDQMKNGFERIYDVMPDIVIDVPAAYNILERFVLRCKMGGLLTDELVRKMPSRGRKRFVSEGDGGLIKEGLW